MAERISARHALTDEEFKVCKIFAGFGFKNKTEAFRRIYTEGESDVDARSKNTFQVRVSQFFERDHILVFLEELKGTGPDAARRTLLDQVQFGETPTVRRQAAEMILDNQDKLGIQDAAERFWEISAAIGADVVVPVPEGGEIVVPVREFFPKFDTPLPPPDVLYKTLQSLDQYLWIALGKAKGMKRERHVRQWKFGMGMKEFEAGDGSSDARA